MSESVFVGLIVGTSQQVAIKRETRDIEDLMLRQIIDKNMILNLLLSGSRSEGFRHEGSDVDIMVSSNVCQVIMDVSMIQFYRTSGTVLFLSDSTKSPPGFTLLQVLTPNKNILHLDDFGFFARMHEKFYLTCSGFKKWFCLELPDLVTIHGPCAAGFIDGYDIDIAVCLACDSWPSSASSWIDRCDSWPDSRVVNDIVRNGCHFVAIGRPSGQYEHIEWRISFSRAEQKCVYAMNHTQ